MIQISNKADMTLAIIVTGGYSNAQLTKYAHGLEMSKRKSGDAWTIDGMNSGIVMKVRIHGMTSNMCAHTRS